MKHAPPPRESPLDVANYPLAPPSLTLEQVHVYVRHGERAPVGIRLNTPAANLPEHWLMCTAGRAFRAAVYGPGAGEAPDSDKAFLEVRRAVERKDGTGIEGECMLGELTDIGRQSTYNYGVAMRKLYIEKLGFLPDVINDEKAVYFRSTNMPRTIESLQQVVQGLYPNPKYGNGIVPKILIRNGKDENLMGNNLSCKRLELLNLAFAQGMYYAFNPLLAPLDSKLSKYIGGPLRIDGRPRASGILDTIRAAQAHGLKVPAEFEEKETADILEKSVVAEWFAGCKLELLYLYKTHEFRRLAMGRLLDDLQRKMTHKAKHGDRNPLKLLIHSTHDTALAGLCSTLDVFDERWPAFTASITFELFRKETAPPPVHHAVFQSVLGSYSPFPKPRPEYYVRMRYQNRSLPLPICSEEGKHFPGSPEFCTLAAFRERVRELTPDDFERECTPANRIT
ncbi:phosphoglycerate mutase-like protein [Ramaria rubella]|nr:phosphoglycerate mutase-like protein [Ramaria rubella]